MSKKALSLVAKVGSVAAFVFAMVFSANACVFYLYQPEMPHNMTARLREMRG